MNDYRLVSFVRHEFYSTIKQRGFCYIGDEKLFVTEEYVDEIIESFGINIKEVHLNGRKGHPSDKIKVIEDHPAFQSDLNLRDDLVIWLQYQEYLEEKGYDRKFKRKVRKLITECLKHNWSHLQTIEDYYFYNPEQVEIQFIDSVNDLIGRLNEEQKRKTEHLDFFFRGHANIDWLPIPTVYRHNWIRNEGNMFREVLLRNSEEFYTCKSAFEKLTIMQHYGLPTRLLDITKNPLVALFFACSDVTHSQQPAELLVFNPPANIIKYSDSDTVSILSNLAKAERDFKFVQDRKGFNKSEHGTKLLHLIKEEKPYFLNCINPDDFEKTLIVKPINNNERIKRQLGYFFLFGVKINLNQPSEINSLYNKNGVIQKYFIESDRKSALLKELELIGINHDSLFPEIEHGTRYIRDKYGI